MPYHACNSQVCNQGRKQCPCPQACVIPEPDDRAKRRGDIAAIVLTGLVCILALAAAVLPLVM